MLVMVKLLRVLLLTLPLAWLKMLSMNREQFMKVDRVSVALNVKLTDDELEIVRLTGELSVTVGAAVSTVKFQVWLVPVLLALSLHLTYQE